ncbi:zinc-binding dehydrogenase [Sphingobium sp. WCS2017Hpa-17]|uniref:zinc-dependent alcohol dehydrogenase n=1 Tax=Sphingobium sp. WCS2017Hpa-17 TaxID=3073638 RepID=UPI00288B1195|nr:zinc-binding dehydrogenase [Sphingobium sp. WCS2017Hpa-17]
MKAAIFHDPGNIEVRNDVRDPVAGPGEVLLKVAACGICGSDLHLYRTNAHREAGVLRIDEDGLEIPGHEYAGRIVGVGEGVEGWAVGQRVVGVTGGGAFAELVPVPVNPYQIAAIPDGLSYEEAATTEPLADALQLVRLAEIAPGENVVVFGVGIIGLGVLQALKAKAPQAGHVIAVDVSESRLELAAKLGASHVINAAQTDVREKVMDICGRLVGAFPTSVGADVAAVIDCAGYLKHMKGRPPLQQALDMIKPFGGRIVCFGAYEGDVTLDLTFLIEKQPRIIGSLGYQPAELQDAVDLMASGQIDRRQLISDRFALDDIVNAFETQGNGKAIKVMVEMAPAAEV